MKMDVFDPTPCQLGEGPLWHPAREQLFWFDILGKRMLSRADDETLTWTFAENVSAAGWLSDTVLLIASETQLFTFDVETGARDRVAMLDAQNPATRSNDGRADPWGGFWIGTMSKTGDIGQGAFYRYYRGEVRQLYNGITTSNATCFSPDRRFAYFTDTRSKKVMRVALDEAEGWPVGTPEVFLDVTAEGLHPDGAVTGEDGSVWIAFWGMNRVSAFGTDGAFLRSVEVPGRNSSCPAFGGPDLTTLFCTTARQGLGAPTLTAEPQNGMTFCANDVAKGQAEHQVIL